MVYTKITDRDDGVRIISVLLEEVHFENYEEVFDRIRAQVDGDFFLTVLDLSQVRFMDSLSIGMLVPLSLYARRIGSPLCMIGISDNILKLLAGLKLDHILNVRESVEDALAELEEEEEQAENEGGEEEGG